MKVSLLSNLDLLSQPDQLARQVASSSSPLQAAELLSFRTLLHPTGCALLSFTLGTLEAGEDCHVVTPLDNCSRILSIAFGICRRYPTASSILALLIRAISLHGVYSTPPGVGKTRKPLQQPASLMAHAEILPIAHVLFHVCSTLNDDVCLRTNMKPAQAELCSTIAC